MPKAERKEKVQPHPLEGKYIVYGVGYQDDSGEGWSMKLYKMKKGVLRMVFDPLGLKEAADLGEDTDRVLVAYLKENKIEIIFSVEGELPGSPPTSFQDLEIGDDRARQRELNGEDPDETELWVQSLPLDAYSFDDRDEKLELLREAGIQVKFWDARKNKEYVPYLPD